MRWAARVLAVAMGLHLLFVLTPLAGWWFDAMDCQDELQAAEYIICLGGEPQRVLEAARLLEEGYAERLVVSNHGPAAGMMRDLAIEWGAAPDRVLVDDQSWTTRDHPDAVSRAAGIDRERDVCIIVTSYLHAARSRACFEKAGYRRLILREPRWQRRFRDPDGLNFSRRVKMLPQLMYEGAAWVEYWLRGAV
jgi:uncharacterized SAM-binding protein YcdF (DUF218 family)